MRRFSFFILIWLGILWRLLGAEAPPASIPKAGPAQVIAQYALTSANDYPQRDPMNWELLGSNDRGKTWTSLDVRKGEIFSERSQRRIFSLKNKTLHSMYRLRIDSVRDPANATSVQLAEIELLGEQGLDSGYSPSLEDTVIVQGENLPLEGRMNVFDGQLATKWLDFADQNQRTRGSWIQWQYSDKLNLITNVNQLLALKVRAHRGFPIRIEGLLAGRVRTSNQFCFMDKTGGIALPDRGEGAQWHPGQKLVLEGTSQWTNSRVGVLQSQLKILGPSGAAKPARIQPEQTMAPSEDYQWVEAEGQIQFVAQHEDRLVFDLASGQRNLNAQVLCLGSGAVSGLSGARVRVRGICESGLNEKGIRVASKLWVASTEEIQIIPPTEAEWLLHPRHAISELAKNNASLAAGQLVHVRGTVVEQDLGRSLVIEDGTSRVSGFVSSDGTNWVQLAEPVHVTLSNSVYFGLAITAHRQNGLAKATFEHMSAPASAWQSLDIGDPQRAGESRIDGRTCTVAGGGTDVWGAADQFHFLYQARAGEGAIQVRIVTLEGPDPWSKAGIMLRESLAADAKHVFIAATPGQGITLQNRVTTGGVCSQQGPPNLKAPYWLKLTRETHRLVARSDQKAQAQQGATVDALGFIGWEGKQPVLSTAHFVVTKLEKGEPASAEAMEPTLTQVQQIQRLSSQELVRGPNIHLRGVIIGQRGEFIHDGTGSIAVFTRRGQMAHGDFVEIQGRCSKGEFAQPVVIPFNVAVVGRGVMPKAQRSSWSELMNRTSDNQWVEIEGVIRSIEGARLTLGAGDGQISATVESGPSHLLTRLVDAAVRVRGISTSEADSKGQIQRAKLRVPSQDFIEIRKAPLIDPFDIPTQMIGNLRKAQSEIKLNHRVKVEGMVTFRDGQQFFVQDATGAAMAFVDKSPNLESQDNKPIAPNAVPEAAIPEHNGFNAGDFVQVAGFLETGGSSLALTEAIVRASGHSIWVKPSKVTIDDIATGEYDSKLISIEAVLLDQKKVGSRSIFELQTGQRVFQAILSTNHSPIPIVRPGSRLEVTGVCRVESSQFTEQGKMLSSFELLMRTPSDAVILEHPSWWSLKHTLAVVVTLIGILILASGWIRVLRRQVEQRTRELKVEIEEHKRTEVKLKEKTELLEEEIEERKQTQHRLMEEIDERKKLELEKERIHKELISTSRLAGMAEVATGVLHNVGNVLNSVNVSATIVAEKVQRSKAASISKVATLLNEHAANLGTFMTQDEKGQKLPSYLTLLAESVAHDQNEMQQELASLRNHIDHIKEIVSMQQNYAMVSGVNDTFSVADLVEDALKMHSGAYLRHSVRVQREFADLPPITTDKHKVLQVLVNLLHNAKYACDESGRTDKQVTVRTQTNGENRLKIEVADNGIGIREENLTKIFVHGFTTRKGGHGFGLHSGALAAKELGGTLTVASGGPGKGAVFTLELPILQTTSINKPS